MTPAPAIRIRPAFFYLTCKAQHAPRLFGGSHVPKATLIPTRLGGQRVRQLAQCVFDAIVRHTRYEHFWILGVSDPSNPCLWLIVTYWLFVPQITCPLIRGCIR